MPIPAKPKDPAPDCKAMRRHLRLLHEGRLFVYQTYRKAKNKDSEHRTVEANNEVMDRLESLNVAGFEVAVVPNEMSGKGRKSEHCTHIRWLFVDCDKGRLDLGQLLALPVRPNLVVETSPGHLHPYWRVDGCSVQQFPRLQAALAAKLGEENSVSDPSRCMRLAGTLNHKRGKPTLVTIVYPEVGKINRKVRQLNEFVETMELDVNAGSPKVKAVPMAPDSPIQISDSGALSEVQVRICLNLLSSDDRPTWLKVGKALKSRWPGEDGYAVWAGWSRGSAKFEERDQRRQWQAMNTSGGITLGTLVDLAGQQFKLPGNDERELADALALAAKDLLFYSPGSGKWWRYAGGLWESSKGDREAQKFFRGLDDLWGLFARKTKQPKRSLTTASLLGPIRQAQLDDRMCIDETCFDADPFLLGLANGVVDLRTGQFRPPQPADRITMKAKVSYDPDATCPQFQRFVDEIFQGRIELRKYLMRALGYTLTGVTKEQVLFMPMGQASNGKGVLLNLMKELLGDYATTVSPMLLMGANSGNPNAPSPALMAIRGARMLICTELQEGKKLDEAFIKQLTGGDRLVGREGYGQQTEFAVSCKLWVSSNHEPEIAYGAEAMWRRIRVVPFDAQFLGAASDPDLSVKLIAEAPGILNLLVRSSRCYLKDGLAQSNLVEKATAELRGRLDSVQQWLGDHCYEKKDARLGADDAYQSYRRACKSFHRSPLATPAFKAAMISKRFDHKHRREGNFYEGLRLLNE